MSAEITNREYLNPFTELTEPDHPDWPIGNTGDWIKATFDIEAGIDFVASSSEPISLNFEEKEIKLMNGKKWRDYGFDLNRTIKFTYTKTTYDDAGVGTATTELFDVDIIGVHNDTMRYDDSPEMSNIDFEMIPTDRGNVKITSVKLYEARDLQGVSMKYCNIPNSEVENHGLNSLIDGTKTEAIYVGLNNIVGNGFVDMELLGLQSGMSIDKARIRVVGGIDTDIKNWTIPNSGLFQIITPPYAPNKGMSIQMNYTDTPEVPYQQSYQLYYNSWEPYVPNQMFIYNSNFTGVRDLKLKVGTVIQDYINKSHNSKLELRLNRFTGGAALNFAGSVVLKSYNCNDELRSLQLDYDNTVTLNIVDGESYSLGYLWGRPNTPMNISVIFATTNYAYAKLINVVADESYKKKYQIELNYMLSSLWEQRENFLQKEPPAQLFNAATLTDNMLLEFYPEWNNPNIITKNDMADTERLGNTGWFNENYNGLPNDFTVKSLKYEDMNGNQVDSLSYGGETKVKILIGGIPNLVNTDSKFNYGFIWVPLEEEEYKNKTTGFHKNTKVNNPVNSIFDVGTNYGTVFQGFAVDNAKMNVKNIISNIVGGELYVEMTFSPTVEFTDFFLDREQDRAYALWISVEDSQPVTNFSDRVNLLLDVNEMFFNITIDGSLPNVNNRFIEHPQGNAVTGVELYEGFVEDDILARTFFQIKSGEILKGITFGFEVENIITGSKQTLERYAANIGSAPVVNGVAQVNLNTTRGYLLPSGNNKNYVVVTRKPTDDTTEVSGYEAYFAQKIRWEYWLQKFNILPEFFDGTKEFDGFNNNWLDYLRNSGIHKFNYFVLFDVDLNGTLKRYKNDFEITFNGYDENPNIETQHNYYSQENNTLINIGTDPSTGKPLGVLLGNRQVRLEIIYTNLAGDFDIGNVYCTTTMQIHRGAGAPMQNQISSIWDVETSNPLRPMPGLTKLKVEQIASNVIKSTCLIDGSMIEPAPKFAFSGRIGCFSNINGIPIVTKKYEHTKYESKYE